MTGKIRPFVYRESVRTYLRSPEVRHAVNLLLDRKIGYMPQAFAPKEIADFYKACLAARQTQIDFVQDMVDMWHDIWPVLKDPWQQVPFDPASEELTLDPAVRWAEGYFQRSFRLAGMNLDAHMWLILGGNEARMTDVELGFSLLKNGRTLLSKDIIPSWRWDKTDKLFRYDVDDAEYRDGLDLTKFRKAAQAAVRLIKRFEAE